MKSPKVVITVPTNCRWNSRYKKIKNNECKKIENVIIYEEKYMNKYIDNFMESIEILISQ